MGGVRAIAAAMYVNAALEGAIIVILSRGSDVCCCAELGDWIHQTCVAVGRKDSIQLNHVTPATSVFSVVGAG